MEYEVYTDGSCKGNPGPGGIGAVVYRDGSIVETYSQGYYRTTNNRMELRAVIEVLKKYGNVDKITVWTDSEYVRKGITQWMDGWKRNGWARMEGGRRKPVKNVDLWEQTCTQVAQACSVLRLKVLEKDGHFFQAVKNPDDFQIDFKFIDDVIKEVSAITPCFTCL